MNPNQAKIHRRATPKLALGLLVSLITILAAAPSSRAQNGTWTNFVSGSGSGSWATAANWLNGIIAGGSGNTADFSTLSLTTPPASTNTLDGPRTIGNLIFANGTTAALATSTNWVVNASATNTTLPAIDAFTIDSGAASPVINVSNQIAVINASVFGTNGFIKAGAGTLRLNGVATNATGTLGGPIYVNNGDLQVGNATALGIADNAAGFTTVFCTNGGSVEVISAIAPNNYQLFLGGTGDGTIGALYANSAFGLSSTRWGLSISNANSSVAAPAIILVTNATIQVDGVLTYTNTPLGVSSSNNFLAGFISCITPNGLPNTANITNSFFTLTKTGFGNLELERGMMVSNVVVQAGSVFPDAANAFNSVQQWTVRSGAAILNNQQNTFNANTISLQIDAGGLYDANFRGNGNVNSDNNTYTQNLGTLTGAGIITCGEKGEGNPQTLNIIGTNNNSLFTGTITSSHNDIFNLGKTAGANTTVKLTGINSYSGTTTVSAGTWLVDGSHTGGIGYAINNGAVLGGSGSISPPITNNGSFLVAGDGGGTLTVNNVFSGGGDTTIASNANLTVTGELGSSGAPLGALYLSNATLQLPLLGSSPSAFVSTLTVDGQVTLVYTSANPAVGDFPIIAYSSIGGLAGGGINGITLVTPPGTTAVLSNNFGNSSIDVVVTAVPALIWRGTPTGDWSIGGSANWVNGATPVAYTETAGSGPFVTFDDTATGSKAVNLTTTVSPKGITVNNTLLTYTNTGPGLIAGPGGLLKEGSGILILANTGTNTFAGTLALQSGEVRVGNGGAAGTLGAGPVLNGGQLTFNRNDNVTVTNLISGAGTLAKSAAGTATLTGITNYGGAVSITGGTLAFAPIAPVVLSNNITGTGTLAVTGGEVTLEGTGNTWSGGTLITNGGILEVGDANSAGSLPGNVNDNGTLAFGSSDVATNDISGAGGVLLLTNSSVTFTGVNNYTGPTVVLQAALTTAAANYPLGSALTLGDQTGGSGGIGTVNVTAGNLVVSALNAGGNTTSPNQINLEAGGQSVIVNGNVSVGATTPIGASVLLQPSGTGVSFVINDAGGTFQIGLGNTSSGVNPDSVLADFSQIDNLIVNLGTNGQLNLGTLDGNPGPQAGATVVNQLQLANLSNSITAGAITVGAGGRQLTPDLRLSPGTNIFNVGSLNIGTGGRDGGQMEFYQGSGGLTVRGAAGGSSRAEYNQGVNATSGTAAGFTTTVDFTGGAADLLFDAMVIGNEPVRAANSSLAFGWQNTFTFNQGTLNANSVSLSGGCLNGTTGSSTMNITGGTASLGTVSLTASFAPGTLNISGNATVTVSNITSAGTGGGTLALDNATLNISMGASGNPVIAPVAATSFSASDTVNLGFSGSGFTPGEFPLFSYTGSIGGGGFSSLNLTSLPTGVSGFLTNNAANLSVDVVITSAPPTVNTNRTDITFTSSSGTLSLSWPPDHKGWTLETNNVGLTATNQWFAFPGSASLTNVSIPVDSTKTNVFFRLHLLP